MLKTALLATVALIAGCYGTREPTPHNEHPVELAVPPYDEVIFEVDYVEAAAPAFGVLPNGEPLWEVLRKNAERLLRSSAHHVSVPTTREAMGHIPDEGTLPRYTDADIRAIAFAVRDTPEEPRRSVFHVLFLNGEYEQGDGTHHPEVLGAHLADSQVLAIFPERIRATGLSEERAGFMEQVALVHELGHAFGLVDDGLAMQSEHHDDAHPGHCDDPECVMQFVPTLTSSSFDPSESEPVPILFGPACLQDADALERR